LVGRGRGMILVELRCFLPLPTIWGDIGVSPNCPGGRRGA